MTDVKLAQPVPVDFTAMPAMLKRVIGLAMKYPWHMVLAIGAGLGATIFNLVIPRLLGRAVDQAHFLAGEVIPQAFQVHQGLLWTGLLLAGASALRGLLQMLSGYQAEYVAQRVGYDLRLAFFEKLQRLDFEFHDNTHSGDLITRGMLDLEGVRVFIEMGMQRFVMLAMLLLMGCWMLFSTDPLMAVLALSFVPFVAWQAFRTAIYLRLSWTKLQECMSVLTRYMEESLQGMRVVRAFAAKSFEMMKFDKAADLALRLSNRRIFGRTGSMSVMTLAFYTSMAIVLWVGGHRVQSGQMTIGHLTEILAFMTILQQPVRQITMIVNSSARATSSGVRLFDILDREPRIKDRADARELVITGGHLRFQNVSFSYATASGPKLILSDISFEVGAGRTLGIVGAPGAGKSTLIHLIPRFYDVTGGGITIDGQDVRDVTLHSLRKAVGIVQQDVFLFDDSVASNVAYGDPDAEDEKLFEATATSQLHDYLKLLPDAYDTRIGERGVSLSGGQRQRLSIARGLVPAPSILIFDDATSAIDVATEQRVRSGIRKAAGRRTTIIIAHRLSSVMNADEILFLEQGRIVERGRHAELVALGGRYAELFSLQSSADKVFPTPENRALTLEASL